MKMIVGLGNPGAEYARTKHNAGWILADALAEKWQAETWRQRDKALIAAGWLQGEKIIIVKPLTYMNLSGEAVGPLVAWYKLPLEDLIVAHDDMDIPIGTIRLRKKGSAGGHNGIKSLLAHLPAENFPRVRIGIGRPLPNQPVINHVLSPFSAETKPLFDEAINYLIPAVETIVTAGIDLAMNRFNPKKAKKTPPEKAASPKPETQNEAAGDL